MSGSAPVPPSPDSRHADVTGVIHVNDTPAMDARAALLTTINELSARTPHTEIVGDLKDRTFHLGVHHQDRRNRSSPGPSRWTPRTTRTRSSSSRRTPPSTPRQGSTVNLIRGAKATNVYWVVGDAAGTGANTSLSGTILAYRHHPGGRHRAEWPGSVADRRHAGREHHHHSGPCTGRPVGHGTHGRKATSAPVCRRRRRSQPRQPRPTRARRRPHPPRRRLETALATSPGTSTSQTPPASSTPGTPPEETVSVVESTEPDAAAEPSQTTGLSVTGEVTAP